MSKNKRIAALDRHITNLYDVIDDQRWEMSDLHMDLTIAHSRLTALEELVVGLQETQRHNQLRIIKLEEATTHKPYYIPTPAPYKRWEDTPIVADWAFRDRVPCDSKAFPVNDTTVDL